MVFAGPKRCVEDFEGRVALNNECGGPKFDLCTRLFQTCGAGLKRIGGAAIVWPVLECPIPPSKRPLASFECFAPPKAPSERGPPAWTGPAGCAVLLQAPFDECLDCCPGGDLGGEEGCAADRASAMLEPPLGGGSGERQVQPRNRS